MHYTSTSDKCLEVVALTPYSTALTHRRSATTPITLPPSSRFAIQQELTALTSPSGAGSFNCLDDEFPPKLLYPPSPDPKLASSDGDAETSTDDPSVRLALISVSAAPQLLSESVLTERQQQTDSIGLVMNHRRNCSSVGSSGTYLSIEAIEALESCTRGGKGQTEGCRSCRRDDDHPNLLLCEICNDEYHTYCLNPPLSSVPDHDFFCHKCSPPPSFGAQDGLNNLVSALSPTYTCRFGEIIWAAGGQGFGWWPACIYDPRLTVGGARKLAIKHLGKKHLVYFFACHDAPFTVLMENKIVAWEDGLLEEHDMGKTARAVGRSKTTLFEQALQAAIAENDKPVEYRLDWNHEDKPLAGESGSVGRGVGVVVGAAGGLRSSAKRQQPAAGGNQQNLDNATRKRSRRGYIPGTNGDKAKTATFVRRSNRGGKPLSNHSCSNHSEATIVENALQLSKIEADERELSENNSTTLSSPSTKMNRSTSVLSPSTKRRSSLVSSMDGLENGGCSENSDTKISPSSSPTNNKKPITNRCKVNDAIKSMSKPISNEIVEFENGQFFCKIFWKMSKVVVVKSRTSPSTIDDARVNVGFISLPCKKTSTFADMRKVMIRDLDEDCIPPHIKWKFYIPNLGPMSMKQEEMFGPVLVFLRKSTLNEQLGDGSNQNPLKIIIFECG